MDLTPIGLWTHALDHLPMSRAKEVAAELETLGYGAIWIPEMAGRDPFVSSALLLEATERIVLATGIANIYSRDPLSMACAHNSVTEAFPERFLLGIGVSHQSAVEGLRGQTYGPPLATMRAYLDGMDIGFYLAEAPTTPTHRVLAALGPKMLGLAATRAEGAHPYFVPVEHTVVARETMGPDAGLYVEQMAVLDTDPGTARTTARGAMAMYLGLPNYTNNLLRLGWTEEDIADGGSDRLVDAIVAWGDEAAIAARVQAHRDAGADHVCVQVLSPEFTGLPLDEWRRLAPALVG
jgi:probable F420-dependent oxidoreductase